MPATYAGYRPPQLKGSMQVIVDELEGNGAR